jgi:hypothetical protein
MDIHKINIMVDLFMKRLYDVDVYLSESKYGDEQYRINILVFPSKFLKGSPEFSEKYYNFFNRKKSEILDDIFKAFKYLGISSEEIENDSIYTVLSSDIPDYLKKYNKEFISNINEFIKNKEVANIKLSEHISNVKINRIESFVPDGSSYTEPYIDLRLSIDSVNKNLDPYSFLNDDIFRKPLMDYLNERMNLDSQIGFWFE